jgi:hypothetical protein
MTERDVYEMQMALQKQAHEIKTGKQFRAFLGAFIDAWADDVFRDADGHLPLFDDALIELKPLINDHEEASWSNFGYLLVEATARA